jgi:hypothetical protein
VEHKLLTILPLGLTYGVERLKRRDEIDAKAKVFQNLTPFRVRIQYIAASLSVSMIIGFSFQTRATVLYVMFSFRTNLEARRLASGIIKARFGSNRSDVDYG